MSTKDQEYPEWKKLSDDLETIAIFGSYDTKEVISNCVAVPIVTSGIFATGEDGHDKAKHTGEWDVYTHGRHGNPTRNFLENYLAKIEGCKYSLAFSSGCAAVHAILHTILSAGSHVIAMKTMYGGTTTIMDDFGRFGVTADYVDDFENTEQQILALMTPATKIIWLESPVNPTLQLVDLQKIVQAVKSKFPKVTIVCDNTFLTPVFQRPLDLGVDITILSCSKYMGGHADIVMGSIATNSFEVYKSLRRTQEANGAIPSSVDCYMLIRSLKTLPIRMRQHSSTAFKLAAFLEKHPKILQVIHPGLTSHPQHNLALKQQFGHSGAVGFYLKGGLSESVKFLNELKVILIAPSLGADISIANIPSRRSHAELPKDVLEKQGITDNFIRLSVGLESSESLIADLTRALSMI